MYGPVVGAREYAFDGTETHSMLADAGLSSAREASYGAFVSIAV